MVIDRYKISPFQVRILTPIWEGNGLPISAHRLFASMYADDENGGPEDPKAYAALKQGIHNIRGKLEGSVVSIENCGYRGGYRLKLAAQ